MLAGPALAVHWLQHMRADMRTFTLNMLLTFQYASYLRMNCVTNCNLV